MIADGRTKCRSRFQTLVFHTIGSLDESSHLGVIHRHRPSQLNQESTQPEVLNSSRCQMPTNSGGMGTREAPLTRKPLYS